MRLAFLLLAATFASCIATPGQAVADGPAESAQPPAAPSRIAEVRAARDSSDRVMAVLRDRLAQALTRADAQALGRQIARAKIESEAAILRIQAAWALREGQADLAARLEREAAALLAPRPRDGAAAARRGPEK